MSKNKTGHIEKEWKLLLLGGFIGSILNGISSSFLHNNGVLTSSMFGYILDFVLRRRLAENFAKSVQNLKSYCEK